MTMTMMVFHLDRIAMTATPRLLQIVIPEIMADFPVERPLLDTTSVEVEVQ
jgi:hypothetical protein